MIKAHRKESEGNAMRKRTANNETVQPRFLNLNEFAVYTGLGKNSAMKLGRDINCIMRVGGRVLYDTRKADQYFNSFTGVN